MKQWKSKTKSIPINEKDTILLFHAIHEIEKSLFYEIEMD